MIVKNALSVIVPMYNVVRFLRRHVDALSKQNQDLISIIFVDDGSTDGTVEMLRSVLLDSRLKAPWCILEKSNGGLSDARNFGLDHCKTDFVTFLDPDDDISDNFYESLLHRLEETGSSVVLSSSVEVWPDGKTRRRIYEEKVHEVEGDLLWMLNYDWSACTKVFRRSLFNGKQFDTGLRFEDLALVPFIVASANRFCVCNNAVYYYHRRADSIMLDRDIEKENDIFFALEKIACRLRLLGKEELVWRLIVKVLVLSFVPHVTLRYSSADSRAFAIRVKAFLRTNAPHDKPPSQEGVFALLKSLFLVAPLLMRWLITLCYQLAFLRNRSV